MLLSGGYFAEDSLIGRVVEFCVPHMAMISPPDTAVCGMVKSGDGPFRRNCVTLLAFGRFQPAGSQKCRHERGFLSSYYSG